MRASDAELDRISDESRRIARVFLTYVLSPPVSEDDLAFIRDQLELSLGDGYRIESSFVDDRPRFQVFRAATDLRICDQVLIPHGIPAPPGA